MSSSINKSVNVERRTWDKETYEARGRSRAAAAAASESSSAAAAFTTGGTADADSNVDVSSSASAVAAIRSGIVGNDNEEPEEFVPAQQGRAGPMGSQRAFLKSRSRKVDLEGKLGSTEIIDPSAASATRSKLGEDSSTDVPSLTSSSSGVTKCKDGVGWHCRVCDCFLKDSLTYLDHINGRKHQRYLGYTMRVEQTTTAEVVDVLKSMAEEKKRQRDSRSCGFGGILRGSGGGGYVMTAQEEDVDFKEVVRRKDEEAHRKKAERARRREEFIIDISYIFRIKKSSDA